MLFLLHEVIECFLQTLIQLNLRLPAEQFLCERYVRPSLFWIVLGLLFSIATFVLLTAKGERLPMQHIIPVLLGLLLVIIGNYFGKLRKNFFAGIRTPWTLASNEVWTAIRHGRESSRKKSRRTR